MYDFNGYNGYGYTGFDGATPDMRRRLEVMQAQQRYSQQTPNFSYGQQPPVINGRIVTGIDEARAAQIPLDGTIVYFPSPAEKKIYVKSIGLDGMPLFNTYKLSDNNDNNIEKQNIDSKSFMNLEHRIEQLEKYVFKGVEGNVQSNANVNEQSNAAINAVAK